jgi:hypothetical protein
MSGISFSDKTIAAFNKIDTTKNGVSVEELKTLDKDNDNNISLEEAQQAGISETDLETINKSLANSADHDPAEIVFAHTMESRGGVPALEGYRFNSENNKDLLNMRFGKIYGFTSSPDDKLAILDKRLNATLSPQQKEQVKPLLDFMAKNGILNDSVSFAGIEAFIRRLGPEKAAEIGKLLTGAFNNPDSKLNLQDKKELFKNIIQDIGMPGLIDQGSKGTCAACSVQTLISFRNPELYTKMAIALVEGNSFTLPSGKVISPNDSWKLDAPGKEQRSITCKVLQNAIMNFAGNDYKSNLDINNSQAGLNMGKQVSAQEGIFGDNLDYDADFWHTKSAVMDYIEDEIARGRPALVNFSGHAITVVGIDKSANPPTVIIDTWGNQLEVPMDEFKKYIQSAVTVNDEGSDDKKVADNTRTIIAGADLTQAK